MIHPQTEVQFISEEIGYGVVATSFIPAGTITWVQDELDQVFSLEEVQGMSSFYQKILDTYSFKNKHGNFILCWDNARYVNHSFRSNCLTTAYDFEIAIRDIQAGEQLTDDYGYLNIDRPFRGLEEGTHRKVVYPDDLLKYHSIWDEKLMKVFPLIPTIQQPLQQLIHEKLWKKVVAIASGQQQMDSILTNYYHTENYEQALT